ncbi:MAG TPA: sulfite exporter TauE/SafE family protein [Stellaceae bacterium]|nr:sulfite exporter TauE/SafE family protein [Stellaceae bacterium]
MLTKAVLGLPLSAKAGLFAAFVVGGVVKGVLGIGLPLVLVPLTAQFLDLPVAVALLSVPIVIANVPQALEGGQTRAALRRLAPILVTLVLGTLFGVHLLVSVNRRVLDIGVGVSFVLMAILLLCLPRIRIGRAAEPWVSPLVGLMAGILGGVTAIFGPPLIAYQIGLGVNPGTFVKHMAILAFTATMTLLLALGGSGALGGTDLLISAVAIIPIQIGMPLGRWLRGRVPPAVFRAAVLCALAWAGLDMLGRGLF